GVIPSANVGKPSAVHSQRVPLYSSATFDVIANLKALFQLAFSLNFHLPPSPGDTFNAQGLPTGATVASEIGKGSLTQLAGALTAFTAVPLLGAAAGLNAVAADYSPDQASGQYPQAPWQTFVVKFNATRLSVIVGGAILNANNAQTFEQYMIGPYPKVPTPK